MSQMYRSRRTRKSIRLDRVHPSDFFRYDFIYACEQCSHFSQSQNHCSIGFNPHTRDEQLKLYEVTGRMAFCRYQEID